MFLFRLEATISSLLAWSTKKYQLIHHTLNSICCKKFNVNKSQLSFKLIHSLYLALLLTRECVGCILRDLHQSSNNFGYIESYRKEHKVQDQVEPFHTVDILFSLTLQTILQVVVAILQVQTQVAVPMTLGEAMEVPWHLKLNHNTIKNHQYR